MNIVTLKHPYTGQLKLAPIGKNSYAFWFSILVPLKRGDWKIAGIFFIIMALALPLWLADDASLASRYGRVCAFSLILYYKYNKWYLRGLLMNGYKITSLPAGMTPEELSKKTEMDIKSLMA